MNGWGLDSWGDSGRYAVRRRPRSAQSIIHHQKYEVPLPNGFGNLKDLVRRRKREEGIEEAMRMARVEMGQERVRKNAGKERLADLRLLSGFSQEELAVKIGTSQPRLSRWEAGKDKPGYDNIVALAHALRIDFNRLHEALANG